MSGSGVERWVDAAIGERREALVQGGRIIALRLLRESDEGRRARWGEVYAARVRTVDPRRRGAFVDLGLSDQSGFLPLDSNGKARIDGAGAKALVEGQSVVVLVVREAARGKNPVLRLLDEPHPGGPPERVAQHDSDSELEAASAADLAHRSALDSVIEDALARSVAIPGGGGLIIEPTAALVAIDVDAGGREGPADAERFALQLNLAAVEEIARQVRIRGLGGLIAIDFVSMRAASSRRSVETALKKAFASDPCGVRFERLSKFGVVEVSRGQQRAPLHEIMREPGGRMTPESVALEALRAIEREARTSRGREVIARLAPEVAAWLEAGHIAWRDRLSQRAGLRWSLESQPGQARERIDVRTV